MKNEDLHGDAGASSALDQLEAQAHAVDAQAGNLGGAADPVAAGAAVPAADPADEVAALLEVVTGILAPVFPCLPGIYDEATRARIGAAAAPVLAKYDVSVGGLLGRYGEELMLLATVAPIAAQTVIACKADIAARNKKDEPAPAAPGQAENTGVVVIG